LHVSGMFSNFGNDFPPLSKVYRSFVALKCLVIRFSTWEMRLSGDPWVAGFGTVLLCWILHQVLNPNKENVWSQW
jgi:hypothetical protein